MLMNKVLDDIPTAAELDSLKCLQGSSREVQLPMAMHTQILSPCFVSFLMEAVEKCRPMGYSGTRPGI